MSEITIDDPIAPYVVRAAKLRDSGRRTILAIAGPPGVGKSTFAEGLVRRLNSDLGHEGEVTLLPMDGYHHTNAWLDERGWRSIKGAPQTFDAEAYITLLRNVREYPDEVWTAPAFDREVNEPYADGYRIEPDVRLVVTEGNYLLLPGEWAPIKTICDETWLLEINLEEERRRLIARHVLVEKKSLEAAIEFVDRSDLANARRVVEESTEPTLRVTLPHNPELALPDVLDTRTVRSVEYTRW